MRHVVVVRTLIAALAVGILVSVSSGGALGQGSGEEVALLIEVLNCESPEELGAGPCEPAAGVDVSVASTSGEALGSCTTEAGTIQSMDVGFCYVDVPVGDVVVTEDVSTVAEGYAPVENPRTVEVRAPNPDTQDYIPVALFFNVPVTGAEPDTDEGTGESDGDTDGDTDESTGGGTTTPGTTLPKTGTGPIGGQSSQALAAAMLVLASIGTVIGLRGRFAR